LKRFILAPEAVRSLAQIWRHTRNESSIEAAERVDAMIRSKFANLAKFPLAGHLRPDPPLSRRLFLPRRVRPEINHSRSSARCTEVETSGDFVEGDLAPRGRLGPEQRNTSASRRSKDPLVE